MLMPSLSLTALKVSAEGSIDPWGLYAQADALAVQQIPRVREHLTGAALDRLMHR